MLISYAIGALLGAVFLANRADTLSKQTGNAHNLAAVILGGILFFFVLEKLVLWGIATRRMRSARSPRRPNDHGRSGMMNSLPVVGDTIHNFSSTAC